MKLIYNWINWIEVKLCIHYTVRIVSADDDDDVYECRVIHICENKVFNIQQPHVHKNGFK